MKDLFIDVETYSSVDITKCGAYKYVESPDFEILIIGYAFDDQPVKQIDLANGQAIDDEFLFALTDPDVRKHAHNAVFERLCFKRIGFDIPAEQWYCTSVKSAYCGLPLSLDAVSKVLDLKEKKLETGKLLIKYFSCPCKPTLANGRRTRNMPSDAPDKWQLYLEYNDFDVRAEREIYNLLSKYEIPAIERDMYVLDQHINDNGILIDMELAEAAVAVDSEYRNRLTEEAIKLTGLENPNSPTQIKDWLLLETGEWVDSLSKDNLTELIDKFSSNDKVSKLLNIRKKLSKTSVKKYDAMLNCAMADNRARGTFQFYGANRTGRWAGRLIQLQNLSKNHLNELDEARNDVKNLSALELEMLYDDVADLLSQLVRTAFIAPTGYTFSVADFSAIEARVISWLSGEDWRMEVFRGDGKIYEATGSKMFNVPIESITKGSELRQKSKISELALGYEGSVGALTRMGGDKMGLSNAEMASLVSRWRLANPKIVQMWADFQQAAIMCIKYGTEVKLDNYRGVTFNSDYDFMTVSLPSGRKLFYRHPNLSTKAVGRKLVCSIKYEGMNQETKQWGLTDTYGGKLTENIVQAIARDLLAYAMLQLERNGYKICMHIHDEAIAEVPEGNAKEYYDNMVKIMSTPPEWASDLPLRADGYITKFYKKD